MSEQYELEVVFTGSAADLQAAATAASAAMDAVMSKFATMQVAAKAMADSVAASMASVVSSVTAAEAALNAFGLTQVTASINLDTTGFTTALAAAQAAAEAGITIPVRYDTSAAGVVGGAVVGTATRAATPGAATAVMSAAAGSQMASDMNGGQYDAAILAMKGATPAPKTAAPAAIGAIAGAVGANQAAGGSNLSALTTAASSLGVQSGTGLAALQSAQEQSLLPQLVAAAQANRVTSGAGLGALLGAMSADQAAAVGSGSGGGGGGGLLGFLAGMGAGGGGGGLFGGLLTGNAAGLGALGAAIPGVHGLLGLAGFGPEHVVTTALGLGGSLVGAGLGGVAAGAGVAGPLAVGMGSDMAVMSSTIADTKTLATAYGTVQTDQQNATQAQLLMNAAIAQFGPNSAQATAATTAYQSALSTTTTAQVSMDQTIATLSGTTPALTNALTNVQLAQLNVNAAVSAYGANSSQATAATAQLTAAQNAFTTALQQTAPGVAAEIKLGAAVSALNVQWDLASQQARVAAVNIAMALLPIAAEYIPAIADAAQRNFTIVGQYLQPIVDLINGPGMTAFQDLENIFASHIPVAMQVAAQALQLFIAFMQDVANIVDATGGKVLAFFLKWLTYLNTPPGTEAWTKAVQDLINTFYAWWDLVKELTITIFELFRQAPGLGTAIVTTLGNMLEALNKYLSSTQVQAGLRNLFEVHKSEVLALLAVLPPLFQVLQPLLAMILVIEPAMASLATEIIRAAVGLAQFIEAIPGAGGLLEFAAAMLILLTYTRLMAPALALATLGIDILANGTAAQMGPLLTPIAALWRAWVQLSAAIWASIAPMLGFDAAADANPVGLMVIAVAALVVGIALLVTHFQQVNDFLQNHFGPTLQWIQNLLNGIAGGSSATIPVPSIPGTPTAVAAASGPLGTPGGVVGAPGPGTGLVAQAGGTSGAGSGATIPKQPAWMTAIQIGLGPLGTAMTDWGLQMDQTVIQTFNKINQTIHDVLGSIGTDIRSSLSAIGSFVGGVFSGIGSAIHTALSTIGTFVGGAFSEMGSQIHDQLEVIRTIFMTVLAIILGFWIIFFEAVFNATKAPLAAIGSAIETALNFIRVTTVAVWGAILAFLTSVWNDVKANAESAWNLVLQYVLDPVQKIWTTVIQPIWNQIKAFLQTVWNDISSVALTIWNTIFNTIFGQVQKTQTTAIEPIWNAIRGFLTGIWATIQSDATTAWSAILGAIQGQLTLISSAITSTFNNLTTPIGKAFSLIGTTVQNGVGAIEGVLNTFIRAADKALGPLGFNVAIIPQAGSGAGTGAGAGSGAGLAAGGVFNKATAIVGEAGHPEVVIPLDPAYRDRALQLMAYAGANLMATGGVTSSGAGTTPTPASLLGTLLGGPESVLTSGMSAIGGLWGSLGSGVAKSLIGDLGTWLGSNISKAATAVAGATGGAVSTAASAVSGNVASWLTSALALTGEPLSWLPALEIIAAHESGGNPNASQDITGPGQAFGLMQTVAGTFAAYALPGMNSIFNPIDNAVASIRYIAANYGNPSNTPGVRSIDAGGGYMGYASGGVLNADVGSVVLQPGMNAVMNGTGSPEALSSSGGGQGQTNLGTIHADLMNVIVALRAIQKGNGVSGPLGMIQNYG